MNDMIFYDNLIKFDPTICLDLNPKTLIDSVYPNLNTNYKDVKFMLERLAPTNEDVDYMILYHEFISWRSEMAVTASKNNEKTTS